MNESLRDSRPNLYLIGDSISIHYGPYLQKYLQHLVRYRRKEGEDEALLNLDHPQGANGGDSSMVLRFLQALYQQGSLKIDLLLINCGLHDIKFHLSSQQYQVDEISYRQNLIQIVKLVQEKMKIPLVWIRTTPVDEKVHNARSRDFYRYTQDVIRYNQIADEVMQSYHIPEVDLYTFTLQLGSDLYCDHVHFHEWVRQCQAAFLAGWIQAFIQLIDNRD